MLNKPLSFLRIPLDFKKVLYSDVMLQHVKSVLRPSSLVNEAEDIRYFSRAYSQIKKDSHTTVLNLCKHWRGIPVQSISRSYNKDLTFNTFINLKAVLNSIPTFTDKLYIFDEDVGGGYLVQFIEDYSKLLLNVKDVEVVAPIFFNPKEEEVLDLKDLLFQYSDTSGVFIERSRTWYFENKEIAHKFASVPVEHYKSLAIFFGIISLHGHASLGNNYLVALLKNKLVELGWTEDVPECFNKNAFNNYLVSVRKTLWNNM